MLNYQWSLSDHGDKEHYECTFLPNGTVSFRGYHWSITGPATVEFDWRIPGNVADLTFDPGFTSFTCVARDPARFPHSLHGERLYKLASAAGQPTAGPGAAQANDRRSSWITFFSAEYPRAVAWGFLPLTAAVPGSVLQSLTALVNGLEGEAAKSPQANPDAYAAAGQICRTLIFALGDRDGIVKQSSANGPAASATAWESRSARYRATIDGAHQRFVAAVQLNGKPGAPPAAVPPGGIPLPPVANAAVAPASASAAAPPSPAKPGGLVLDRRWDAPLGLSRGGPSHQGDELRALLTGFANPGKDTGAFPDKPVYRGVTYLQPLGTAEVKMGVAGKLASGGTTAVVGFPDGLKFVEFTPEAGRDFTVRLLKDQADQVVAAEFIANNPNALPPSPDPMPPPKQRHILSGLTYDFVPEGVTSVSNRYEQVAFDMPGYVLICTRGGPHAARSLHPEADGEPDPILPEPFLSRAARTMERPTAPRSFQTTRWSVVRRAIGSEDGAAKQALADLCNAYWYPLYAYFRRSGQGAHDAEDLTQGFFARLFAKNFLAAADSSKGKLRTFLLTDARYFLADANDRARAKKRGGGSVLASFDSAWAEERYAGEPADSLSPDRLYQRRWAVTVLEYSLELLEAEFTDQGKAKMFVALRPFLGFAPTPPQRYEEVAVALGQPVGTLKNQVFRLRERWRQLLFEQVALTLDDPTPEDIKGELAELIEWV